MINCEIHTENPNPLTNSKVSTGARTTVISRNVFSSSLGFDSDFI